MSDEPTLPLPTREDLLREQRDVLSRRLLDLELEMGMLRVAHDEVLKERDAMRVVLDREMVRCRALEAELEELRPKHGEGK